MFSCSERLRTHLHSAQLSINFQSTYNVLSQKSKILVFFAKFISYSFQFIFSLMIHRPNPDSKSLVRKGVKGRRRKNSLKRQVALQEVKWHPLNCRQINVLKSWTAINASRPFTRFKQKRRLGSKFRFSPFAELLSVMRA